jgi:hypothetical protein
MIFMIGFWVARAIQPQASAAPGPATPESKITRESSRESAARSEDSDATLARILTRKVAALEERLNKLPTADKAIAESDRTHAEPPSLTPAERATRNLERIQRIDRALESEPHDGQWSRETTRVLEDLFTSVVPAGSTLSNTTCGETFCRVIVQHENQGARDDFEIYPRKVPGMGVRGLIEHREDGTEQTTLYVVRKEFDTPDHPVRRQDQG